MGFTFQSIQLSRLAHTSHYLDSHGRFHHRFLQLRFRPVPTGVGSSLCIGCFGKPRGRKTTMIWNPTSTLPLRLRSYRVKHFSPTPLVQRRIDSGASGCDQAQRTNLDRVGTISDQTYVCICMYEYMCVKSGSSDVRRP